MNDVGFTNFNSLKTIKTLDFKNSSGIFFINNSLSIPNIKKLLNLKLLNFFKDYKYHNKIIITQSSHLNTKLLIELKKGFNLKNHLHLPNTVLFETSGTYINTEGNLNKVTKIITSLGQTKSDWQIIRKILSYSKKILFMTNYLKKNKITYNSRNIYHFKNYIGFQYYAISNLDNLAFKLLKKIEKYYLNISNFKPKRKKLYNSQLRFWLNDFYIDGKDFNSKYSSTMIQCSKLSRLNNTNFNF